jgi:hypothetical protein
MNLIAIQIFLVLTAIAALHAAWGLGLRWPAHDERNLVALVIGATGRSRMPSMARCLIAAAAIFAAGLVALALADAIVVPLPAITVTVAGMLTALVFVARGLAAYVPAWRRRFAQQPFASLDRNWYGPLCLVLAAGFIVLTIGRV